MVFPEAVTAYSSILSSEMVVSRYLEWYVLLQNVGSHLPDVEDVALLRPRASGSDARGIVREALGERLVVDVVPLGTKLLGQPPSVTTLTPCGPKRVPGNISLGC